MIRIGTNYTVGSRSFVALSSWQLSRGLYHQVATKSDRYFCHTKWDKNLERKAIKLIFSERKYPDFTSEEKRIVDSYQEKILQIDGGVILPNTSVDLEQREIEQLIAAREHKKQ